MNRSLAALLFLPAVACAAPVPKVVDKTKLLVTAGDGTIMLMNPDGTDAQVVHKGSNDEHAYQAWLSPDRKRFAYFYEQKPGGAQGKEFLAVKEIGGEQTSKVEMPLLYHLFWATDGKSLLGSGRMKKGESGTWQNWRLDPETGKRTALDLPAECMVLAAVPKSDHIACLQVTTLANKGGIGARRYELVTTDPDRFEPTTVLEDAGTFHPSAVFPDGKRYFELSCGEVRTFSAGDKAPKGWDYSAGGTRLYRGAAALAPNGKRMAYSERVIEMRGKGPDRWNLWTCEPDGGGDAKVIEVEGGIHHIDWR